MPQKIIIPSHLQIEPLNGICTAHCIMCPVYLPGIQRKPHVMSTEDFKTILSKFLPYQKHLQYLSLVGHGETLLDKSIIEKIRIARDMKFRSIGFPSNCTELTEEMSTALIEAGLNTLICSIDGFTKRTHESIRVGTNFESVVSNVKGFIAVRNKLNPKTKVMIRFVYQDANQHEWEDYYKFWKGLLNSEAGDDVLKLVIHNCGGSIKDIKDLEVPKATRSVCRYIYDRIILQSNGNVLLCCGDNGATIPVGNVLDTDPVEIYNNETFRHYRKMMEAGRIRELRLCKECTI